MDKQEALDALDEMVSALRALLPGAESMGWDTGNARTAISNSEIIRAHLTDPGYVRVPEGLEDYDAGLLNDYGGGNVSWWHDYIRYEVDKANDWWRQQVEAETPSAAPAPADELAKLRERVKELEEIISNNHIDIRRTGNVESN